MARHFQKVNMVSESIKSYNRTGEYQASGVDAICTDGAFVIASGLASAAVYSAYVAGMKDFSKLVVSAPVTAQVTASNVGVYVVDIVKVSDGTINGNVYREGAKTIGLSANAGEAIAMRKLVTDDVFILGADNFASAPTVGQYAILTASSVDLTPASSIPATGFTIKVEQSLTLSEGTRATTPSYLCRVAQV